MILSLIAEAGEIRERFMRGSRFSSSTITRAGLYIFLSEPVRLAVNGEY